jgi:hypothetical protein
MFAFHAIILSFLRTSAAKNRCGRGHWEGHW